MHMEMEIEVYWFLVASIFAKLTGIISMRKVPALLASNGVRIYALADRVFSCNNRKLIVRKCKRLTLNYITSCTAENNYK